MGNQNGTFDFEPYDPTEAGSSGRYRNGFSNVVTQNSFANVSNFVVVGKDDNGDQVKFKVQTTFVLSNGEVRVDKMDVACG